MDENLVGYILDSLDDDDHGAVERFLRQHPDEQDRVERLRSALAPLAADDDSYDPPPGLVVRTLGRVAEIHCRKLPAAPPAPPLTIEAPVRRGWRWADALIAAGILLCILTLLPLLAVRLWHQYEVYSCANNLHKFHDALMRYSDSHDGDLPKVEAQGARSVAGIFVPILNDAGTLDKDVRLTCLPTADPPTLNRSVQDLQELYEQRPDEFRAVARNLSGCYAYTLGYLDGNGLHGPRKSDEGRSPIIADCPPSDAGLFAAGNSPNHGGRGQNVLFLDGAVSFCLSRAAGINGDDIYLNRNNRQAAGVDRSDAVLGPSGASPWPGFEE
jgi:prepilin-type processing-associated H-X9-DG protein